MVALVLVVKVNASATCINDERCLNANSVLFWIDVDDE